MTTSTHPTSKTPADKNTGTGNAAPTPAPAPSTVVADDSVDTENPNDAIEAYHERLRERVKKE